MSKADEYRSRSALPLRLGAVYLLAHSGTPPSPRGRTWSWRRSSPMQPARRDWPRWRAHRRQQQAPVNSPAEFLVFCGVLGLSRALDPRRGDLGPARKSRRSFAADPRWRTREAVAMALQRWGDADMSALLAEMQSWAAMDDPLRTTRLRRQPCASHALLRQTRIHAERPSLVILDQDHIARLSQTPPASPQIRCVQHPAAGARLLLERGRGRVPGEGQASDGKVADPR